MSIYWTDEANKTWSSVWKGISETLIQPGLFEYFESSIGVVNWNGHLLAPHLIFGSFGNIDRFEYDTAIQNILHFLETASNQSKMAKPLIDLSECDVHLTSGAPSNDDEIKTLIMGLHCFTPSAQALPLAQLFAVLFKTFVLSKKAADFVYHRYMLYLKGAIYSTVPMDFGFVPDPPNNVLLQECRLMQLDLHCDGMNNEINLVDSIAIGVMCQRFLKAETVDRIAESWLLLVQNTTVEFNFCHVWRTDQVSRFFANARDTLLGVEPTNHFEPNYNIFVDGQRFAVHDWLIAPVFPYFAQALRANMYEAQNKRMHIPAPFFQDMMKCIIRKGFGDTNPTICNGFLFEIGPLVVSGFMSNPLKEFGITINLIPIDTNSIAYKSYLQHVRKGIPPTRQEIEKCRQTGNGREEEEQPYQHKPRFKTVIDGDGAAKVTKLLWA